MSDCADHTAFPHNLDHCKTTVIHPQSKENQTQFKIQLKKQITQIEMEGLGL